MTICIIAKIRFTNFVQNLIKFVQNKISRPDVYVFDNLEQTKAKRVDESRATAWVLTLRNLPLKIL